MTSSSPIAAEQQWRTGPSTRRASWPARLAWLPVPALIVLITLIRLTANPSPFYDPPWLILIGNLLFITGVCTLVSVIAARNYIARGRMQILLLGCGVLVFGIGGAVAAAVRSLPDGANLNVTIYNCGALLGGLLHFAAAFVLLSGVSPEVGAGRKRLWLVLAYGGTIAVMTGLTVASLAGAVPPFFIQGVGPTVVRQAVLGAAIILFAFSSIVFAGMNLRTREVFLYWYACALALTAISLGAFLLESSVGSLIGWVGRAAQYLGGGYFLAALATAARGAKGRRTSLHGVLSASLAGAEEKFRALFENMTEGFALHEIITDDDGHPCDFRFLDVNPAFERLTGLQRRHLVGKRVREILPGVEPMWIETYGRVATTGEPARFESYSAPLDHWYGVYAYRPRPGQFAVIFSDVTEAKGTEAALKKALAEAEEGKRTLDALMEYVPAGITIAEAPDMRIRMVSRHGQRLLGGPHAGMSLGRVAEQWKVYQKDGLTPMADADLPLLRAMSTGETVRDVELVQVNADGHRLPLLCDAAPIRDGGGAIVGAIVAWRDITDRKGAEDELRRAKDELEQRVRERTAELHARAEQLARLTSELTLAEQRERQRLAQVLHDGLQQLLAAAKFRVGVLERTGDDEVRREASSLSGLLADSLATSRSLTAELSPPMLREGGLQPALEWLARWMDEKHGLTVTLEVADAVGPAPEDVTVLVFQATRELLFNVVKHAGTRAARVRLAAQDGHLEVTVADDGAGFDPADLRLVGAQGGGLGLLAIRERFGHLGGSVEIDSAPGRGSRFTLQVPLPCFPPPDVEAAGRESPPVSVAAPVAELTADSQDAIRIVIIDDHMVVRQGLAALLRGHPTVRVVGEAADGRSGVDLIRRIVPEVALMDISMPGMSGIEATRIVHAELPEVHVIGLSMYDDADVALQMRDAGAVDYVSKSGPSEAIVKAVLACRPAAPRTSSS